MQDIIHVMRKGFQRGKKPDNIKHKIGTLNSKFKATVWQREHKQSKKQRQTQRKYLQNL